MEFICFCSVRNFSLNDTQEFKLNIILYAKFQQIDHASIWSTDL